MTDAPQPVSSYLHYLPAIFQQPGTGGSVPFLGRFLLAFESILSGRTEELPEGIEQILDHVHSYFDPGPGMSNAQRAPDDFLPWLAGWVALSLREDWDSEEKRRFIERIVPLYRLRGTRAGLIEMLHTYTNTSLDDIRVYEYIEPLQVGVCSMVGVDTYVGGGPPHFFRVELVLREAGAVDLVRKQQIARAIIDQEKPAHTYYEFEPIIPTIKVGERSTVGVSTFLGKPIELEPSDSA